MIDPGRPVQLISAGETLGLVANTEAGLLRHQRELRLGLGGSESNVCIGASRLGVRTAWVGRVGDDELGAMVLRELQAEGVDVHAVIDPDAPTALMVRQRRNARQAQVWYYRRDSAGSRLAPPDLPAELITSARVTHLTGITLGLSETSRAAAHAAAALARQAGGTVSFDLNHRAALWAREPFAEAVRDLLPLVDVVFGSEHEFEHVVGTGGPTVLLERMAGLGPGEVVLKRGEHGAVALCEGQVLDSPARRVTVVDTVGAGDAFVAGWLADLIAGYPLEQRMRTAIACGSLACTVTGDWEGAPTRRELAIWQQAGDDVRR